MAIFNSYVSLPEGNYIAILFLPPPFGALRCPWVLAGHHEAHPGLQHLSLQKTRLDDMDATRLAEAKGLCLGKVRPPVVDSSKNDDI